jgi:hypothetical protein
MLPALTNPLTLLALLLAGLGITSCGDGGGGGTIAIVTVQDTVGGTTENFGSVTVTVP